MDHPIVGIRFELGGENVEMSYDAIFDADGKFNASTDASPKRETRL